MGLYEMMQNGHEGVLAFIQGQPWLQQGVDYTSNHPWISLGVLLGSVMVWKIINRPRNLPPGPFNTPFIGALEILGDDMEARLLKARKKYGDVIYMKMMGSEVVVLNSYEAQQEAFVKRADEFSDRAHSPLMEATKFLEGDSIKNEWNDKNKALKKFAVTALKNFGFGTAKSEAKIQNAISKFGEFVKDQDGKPVAPLPHLKVTALCLFLSIFFNLDLDLDDPMVVTLREKVDNWYGGFKKSFLMMDMLLPDIKFIHRLFVGKDLDLITNASEDLKQIFLKLVQEHRDSFDDSDLRDVIDYYIENMKASTNRSIASSLVLPLPDSIDTTSMVSLWILFLLAKYPQNQARLQKEIEDVVGKFREPLLTDKVKLPYTESFLLETMRFVDLIPLSGMRQLRKDTEFRGFMIPKHVYIMPCYHSVHYDAEFFPQPDKFILERFVGTDGLLDRSKASHVLQFGSGPRACMGEQYSRNMLFLFLVHMVQKFSISLNPSETIPDVFWEENKSRGMKPPPEHTLCFTLR